jgi:uncharacterized protein (TIGR03437 family)
MSATVLCALLSHAAVNILTANGGNDRTNSNLLETQLSPATVNVSAFGKLGVFSVDGQVYSQPLVVTGLSIAQGTHNVVFVTTMHNSVYAFDADATSPVSTLWQVNLGSSVPALLLYGPDGDISDEVGILSTGVIDLQRGVLYVVADVLQNGAPVFYLHALDLATGAERLNGPVALAASVRGTGSGGHADGTVPFDPMQHLQRPGLLLANNAVYVSFGSHGDMSPYHGWMLSYDASDLSHQVGVYMSTPNGDAGSIWQSGRGPAADPQGNIYAITGNGDYDGVQNFGESFLKLPAQGSAPLDNFTPSNWKAMSDNDFDISAGPALISGTHTVVGADKAGSLYVIDGDAMSHPGGADIVAASATSIFNLAVWTRGGGASASVYTQGEQEPLKCFQVTGSSVNPTPVSTALNSIPYGRIGMTVSANGDQDGSGILWETSGDYPDGTPGTLHAYDASNLANELWNSDMNSDRDQMSPITKFVPPTVANGKVFVAGNDNSVTVYGLLPPSGDGEIFPSIAMLVNAASYSPAVSPGELVAIFGSNLGPAAAVGIQVDASGSVATTIGDTQVLFDGVASPMVFASASQVNAVVPFGVAAGTTGVQVQYQGQASLAVPMIVVPAAIGIFSLNSSGVGQALVVNQDGSLNSPLNPAAPGSVVTFLATGAGQFSPAGVDGAIVGIGDLPRPILPVLVQVGGQSAEVQYAGGAPGVVEGVIQVNVQIPAASQTGAAVPLVLQVGDSISQPGITLAIQSSAPAVRSAPSQQGTKNPLPRVTAGHVPTSAR